MRLETLDLLESLPNLRELELVRTRIADASALSRQAGPDLLWLDGVTLDPGFGVLGDLAHVTELHLLNHRKVRYRDDA